jgi:hypothetical protein
MVQKVVQQHPGCRLGDQVVEIFEGSMLGFWQPERIVPNAYAIWLQIQACCSINHYIT